MCKVIQKTPIISVCVPTYRRPHMLIELVRSFVKQGYSEAELVISDDGLDIVTEAAITPYIKKYNNIRYIKNEKNLGFSKNLLQVMEKSLGKYIFLLGDDDLIIAEGTLKKYVTIFEENPNVAFIYSNMLQFDEKLNISFVYRFFQKNYIFKEGEDALRNIWLKSTFIAGMGIRKVENFINFYPKSDVLFPQVELIGKLLVNHDAYGLAAYSVGARSHSDQLGFHMMRKERIVGNERHSHVELFEISDNIKKYILQQKKNKTSLAEKNDVEFIVKAFLYKADNGNILAEGTKTDKKTFLRQIIQSKKSEKRISHTIFFWITLVLYIVSPMKVFIGLKSIYRFMLLHTIWRVESSFFKKQKQRIFSHYE